MSALKRTVIVAVFLCLGLYWEAVQSVDKAGPLRIQGADEGPEKLFENIENYDFQGTWAGRDGSRRPFPHFVESSGFANLKVFLSRSDFGRKLPPNVTLESELTLVFHLRLDDGNSSAKAHEHRFRAPLPKELDKPFLFSRRMTIYSGHSLVDCMYAHRVWLRKDRFDVSRELRDLQIDIELSSEDPGCQTSVSLSVAFDEAKSNKQVLLFLMAAFAIAAFEAIVILAVASSLNAFEYNFRFQSVLFWSFNASMNCLNCFVLIHVSSDQPFRLGLFLLAATFNFTNFSLIVLRILTPHVKLVGVSARFGSPNGQADGRQSQAQSWFIGQACLATFVGMACGFCKFPTAFFMALVSLSFGTQVLRTARLNERFFMDSFPGLTLCVAKLIYCVV